MKLAAVTAVILALIVVFAGIFAFQQAESMASLLASIIFSFGLLAAAVASFRGRIGGAALGGVLNFLLAIYFAYRLIATERIFPCGMLLILSFMTLFLILLGVFLGLSKEGSR